MTSGLLNFRDALRERFFPSDQFADFAQADHLRSGRARFPDGAHLLDHAAFKDGLHSLIDSLVKLRSVAEEKTPLARIDDSAPVVAGADRGRTSAKLPRSTPSATLLRAAKASEIDFPLSKQISSARTRRRRFFRVNLLHCFGIAFGKLCAQFIQTRPRSDFRAASDHAPAEALIRGSAL